MEALQQPMGMVDPSFDTQFDVFGGEGFEGLELTDEEFMAAACGAIADIIGEHDEQPEEEGLTNEEIFARLQGVFDVTSERYSADEAEYVQAGMRLMEAIGHAACGNHELLAGAQQKGLLPEPAAEQQQHTGHNHAKHVHEGQTEEIEDEDPKKKKKKRRQR